MEALLIRKLNTVGKIITNDTLKSFRVMLTEDEKSSATIEQYLRCMERFSRFAAGREVIKENAIFSGLAAGTYYLKELDAAEGYEISDEISGISFLFRRPVRAGQCCSESVRSRYLPWYSLYCYGFAGGKCQVMNRNRTE